MLFIEGSDRNRFGYYQIDDIVKTYSLVEAQEYALPRGKPIKWIFNDDVYSVIDWTQEPKQSLQELYASRARQLREQYDYLVLFFSGGSDSHNILSTFEENDIFLDEVLTHHLLKSSKGDKTDIKAFLPEIFGAAIPEAQRLLGKSPHTIHRVIDLSDAFVDLWRKNINDLKFNFIYYNNLYTSANSEAINRICDFIPDYQALIDSGKRICFIHGTDKPYIRYENHRWSFQFYNAIDSSFSILRQIDADHPINDALFYWDPQCPMIPVKQSHEIRKFFYANPSVVRDIMTGPKQHPRWTSSLYFLGANVHINLIKKIIYPWWRNDIIDLGKGSMNSMILGERTPWWHNSGLSGAKEHLAGAEKIADIIGHKNTDKALNQPSMNSRSYYF
jgi:hypothetical protein